MKEIFAAMQGATHQLSIMTNDRIDAMAGSNGTLNIAVLAIIDAVTTEINNCSDLTLSFKNSKNIQLENTIEKLIKLTDTLDVDRANASFIISLILYFSGTDPRAGVPAGNRKLGALCRIKAGVPRGSAVNITSPKFGNKITAFPGVMALYNYLLNKGLTTINGKDIPLATIGTIYMHSILGEDIVLPEIITNGTKIVIDALQESMNKMAMMMYEGMADKITCAIMAAAIMLETVHPDANTKYNDEYIASSHLIGKVAAEHLGIPEKLHTILANEEWDTAEIIGDIGLILKDSGCVSVIAMMCLAEAFTMFKEWLVWTAGPTVTPIASLGGEAWVAMRILSQNGGDIYSAANILKTFRDHWFDPEIGKLALYLIVNKTKEITNGPVIQSLQLITEPALTWSISQKTSKSYELFTEGKTISEVVNYFEKERENKVEKAVENFCSNYFKKEIKLKLLKAEPLGRIAKKGIGMGKFWSIDPNVDVMVIIDGKEYRIEQLGQKWIPEYAQNKINNENEKIAVVSAAFLTQDLSYSGVVIFNITVPVCVATTMNIDNINSLAKDACNAAYLTGGIPGAKIKAEKAAKMTDFIYKNQLIIK